MVVALVVLEALKSTLVTEILSVLEELVTFYIFKYNVLHIMGNIGKKFCRIFWVALEGFACTKVDR